MIDYLGVEQPAIDAPMAAWVAYNAAREAAQSALHPRYARSLRTPPKPPWQWAPGRVCRMCGQACEGRRRTWCSDACVSLWHLATDPGIALYHLGELHGRRCWACAGTGSLEVEHVRPLWSLDADERHDLRWWLPFNLQVLCAWCHKRKTAAEAAQRARLRSTGEPWSPLDLSAEQGVLL